MTSTVERHTGPAINAEAFDILLILLEKPRHGYAVLQALREREDRPPADRGNTYRLLRRLAKQGYVETLPSGAERRPESVKRPVFVVTSHGRSAARAEARRLEVQLRSARRHRLLIGD